MTTIISHPDLLLHDHPTNPNHVERSDRCRAVLEALNRQGEPTDVSEELAPSLMSRCQYADARPVTRAELLLCHSQEHITMFDELGRTNVRAEWHEFHFCGA
mgnify:FL=1